MDMTTQGNRIGPYFLNQMLGEGGQGTVWHATDMRSGQAVALKVMRTSVAGVQEIGRLKREAAILQALRDPGLPQAQELFEDAAAGVAAFAMQFIDGTPLAKVQAQGALSPAAVVALGRELARILSVVHQRGLVHRDIKTSNILLRPGWESGGQGTVVLVDFGIARGTDEHMTKYTATGGAVGTVCYMAPELLLGSSGPAPLEPTTDVYSFGVLLWHLLLGQHPTGLAMNAALSQFVLAYARPSAPVKAPDRAQQVERVAPGLVGLLERCLATDPRQRPPTGAALLDALQRINPHGGATGYQSASLSQPPASTPQPTSWTGHVATASQGHTSFQPQQSWTGYQASSSPPQPDRQAPTQFVQRPAKASGTNVAVILGVAAVSVIGLSALAAGGVVVVMANAREETSKAAPSPRVEPTPQPVHHPIEPQPEPAKQRGIVVFPAGHSFGALRAGPTTASDLLEKLPQGASIYILGTESGGWLRVRAASSGTHGYMHRDIVRPD